MVRKKQDGPELKLCQIDTLRYLTTQNIKQGIFDLTEFVKKGGARFSQQKQIPVGKVFEFFCKNNHDMVGISNDVKIGSAYDTWLRKSGLLNSQNNKYELSDIGISLQSSSLSMQSYCFLLISKQWLIITDDERNKIYGRNLLCVLIELFKKKNSIKKDSFVTTIGEEGIRLYRKQYEGIKLANLEGARYLEDPLKISCIIEEKNGYYQLTESFTKIADDYLSKEEKIRPPSTLKLLDDRYECYLNQLRFGFYDLIDKNNINLYMKTYPDLFQMTYQKIYFGAPGTGKSWILNKSAVDIFESAGNQSHGDEDSRIKESIQNAGSDNAARIAVGLKYSSVLAELAPKSIHENYSCSLDAAYGVFQGTKIESIAKSFSDYEEKDLDAEKIKAELEKIKKDRQASWAAIGYKYSSYLSQKSTGNIQEELGLSKTSSTASWIVSGANAKDFLKDNLLEEEVKRIERVTFHPNYNYAQFVGTYKPVQDEEDDKQIVYKYVPGPFMRVYCNAKRNPNNKFLLLIEEINRANVAAVFGDVFQLLDRKNGESEYPIAASEDIRSFLADNGINEKDLRIPQNMYIWATMNSADQGVFPMDTAFKRRWEFEYIGIDENEDGIKDYEIPLQKKEDDSHEWIKWNNLRHSINDKLTEMKINEDKLLGPYFISEEKLKLVEGKNEEKADEFVKSFKSKVLMYLFEDAVKMRPGDLFDENAIGKLRFSDICKKFDEIGQGIFNFKK